MSCYRLYHRDIDRGIYLGSLFFNRILKNRGITALLNKMRSRLLIIFCLLFFSFSSVRAGSDSSYSDFVSNYRNYQNLLSPFNVAKSKYITYKSVIAQGEYLEASKNLIASEVASVNSFTNFLTDYLNEADKNIGLSENVVLIKLNDLQGRTIALSGRLDTINSLESAQTVMVEIGDLYDEMYRLSYWTKSTIESAGVKKIYDNLGIVKPRLADYLSTLPIIYRENQAANEKYKNLEDDYNAVAEMIAVSYTAQADFEKEKSDPLEVEKIVHGQIQKSTTALYNLVLGYQNILYAVRK